MTQEERILRLDELRKEYKDPTGRSQIAIKLEAEGIKAAMREHEKKNGGKLI